MVLGLCIYLCDKLTCGICCCATQQVCKLHQVKIGTVFIALCGFLATYILFLVGHHTSNEILIKVSYGLFGISVIMLCLVVYFWLLTFECCDADFWLKKCCCIPPEKQDDDTEIDEEPKKETESYEIEMDVYPKLEHISYIEPGEIV